MLVQISCSEVVGKKLICIQQVFAPVNEGEKTGMVDEKVSIREWKHELM